MSVYAYLFTVIIFTFISHIRLVFCQYERLYLSVFHGISKDSMTNVITRNPTIDLSVDYTIYNQPLKAVHRPFALRFIETIARYDILMFRLRSGDS